MRVNPCLTLFGLQVWGPAHRQVSSPSDLTWRRGRRAWWLSLPRALTPFTRAPPSSPNALPSPCLQMLVHWELPTYESVGRGQTQISLHSTHKDRWSGPPQAPSLHLSLLTAAGTLTLRGKTDVDRELLGWSVPYKVYYKLIAASHSLSGQSHSQRDSLWRLHPHLHTHLRPFLSLCTCRCCNQ